LTDHFLRSTIEGGIMARVLVVDDEQNIRIAFQEFLEQVGHKVQTADAAGKAVKLLSRQEFDVVATDIIMPDISGIKLLEFIRKASPGVQVIMITGQPTVETAAEAVRIGAFDYLTKPVSGSILCKAVASAARAKSLIDEKKRLEAENLKYQEKLESLVRARTVKLEDANTQLQREVQERKGAESDLKQNVRKLEQTIVGIIQAMGMVIEKRDTQSAGHQMRVAKLARNIATEMWLTVDQNDAVYAAALIHDLGKIFVPMDILAKATSLTEHEFALIKMHPQAGYDILGKITFPWPIADIILQHHERMNGTGYPQGLSGNDILLEARIIAVADTVEAMSSHRPYRPSLGIEKSLEEILQNKGVFFDENVVDACLKLFQEKRFEFESRN
jgi:putative nucleotidyltransferase with HDIG domain